ncbi:hypothetical protein GCM10022243_20300 [Saccharothrix violaceirubra]|uniref:DUF6875 domain-containing protein n=1 Tax=Saccharothrix violaceirubra TaxID=413306 RepID=A0A7W7T2J8_9PSEU|nr:hypothetical protein [Saccharothrix violaceirubra]MBB4965066.1 hypothetical protein [Saccharothrix violaceirubra]
MLFHPTGATHPLVETADFRGPLPDGVAAYGPALRAVFDWAGEYLVGPHPELGRRGAVCPFTDTSLQRGLFWISVHPGVPHGPDELAELLLHYRDWFVDLAPTAGPAAQFKTILVLFPDLADHTVVDRTQELLKPDYTQQGLMIGEFHPGPPDKAGLWNPAFRPLRSPVPLLAVRHMVPTDFPFLRDDDATVAAYLQRFGDRVPGHLRGDVSAAADRLATSGS